VAPLSLPVVVHDGPLEALAADWRTLIDPAHPGAPFRSYPWVSAWWRHAAAGLEPHVLVARERGRGHPVALLPLYLEPTFLGGRRLRVMADDIVGSDYVGIAARGADEPRAARAFAAHIAARRFDDVYVDGLLAGDPLAATLAPLPRATVTPRYLCPRVVTRGSFDAYLAALPDGTGPQWRRRRRWLERQPGFAIDTLADPQTVEDGLELLLHLHHARWAEGSEAIDGERVERFHREALRGLARMGWVRIHVLRVGGEPAAALYGFRHGDRFAFYQAGRDPRWRARAVGTVLLGAVIERCFTEGLAEFDFLRGDEAYKSRWSTSIRETVAVRVRGPSVRAAVASQARSAWLGCRDLAKSVLGPDAVDGLRRVRGLLRF
jgi:CelD/BcsL family acetyltransferase involved in cellulose biosynthesis